MRHSIFVREFVGTTARPPVLLAYDIAGRSEAEDIIHGIARSYPDHGIDRATSNHWFRYDGRVHEIYVWPT